MNEREYRQKDSSKSEMRRIKKPLKAVELRLVAELMKNSRRSDRELARTMGVSQPTVTRLRGKLEKDGVIREYTMIPDFTRLGYNIMGATLLEVTSPPSREKLQEVRKVTTEIEESNPYSALIAVNSCTQDKNRLFIVLYKNYSDYVTGIALARKIPNVAVDRIQTFLTDLSDGTNYRVLSMSALARDLLRSVKRKGKP